MKGIVLSGGFGTRLLPLTSSISKQLLPVYDRQMIFYPLNTLIKAGIRDILIIVSPEHSGQYLNLLGSVFSKFGISISFVVQRVPKGLAEAFILGEDFIDNSAVTMILGDNIFENDFSEDIGSFSGGGRIFAREVSDPERFGIVTFNAENEVISIEEKPVNPKSHFAIPGIYIFDHTVCDIAKNIKVSSRGEMEITDVHRAYLDRGELDVRVIQGGWFDAGTFDSLLEASLFAKQNRLSERFDPLINEAIALFNQQTKHIVSMMTQTL